ncbi:MAG: ADP-ribosylation factor-like protein [Candidatus Sumerlaeaceae bacterium]|nr:ADP-ribosylation factor-like protein [Candidatus Sumerlaeaceae bacterium]
MPTINQAFKEITCKIVYYGPGFGGKTTNLQLIHGNVPAKHRGDLVSLATEQDQTLFFDFLPLDFGDVKGYKTKFQLYTVPGQVYYNATRKLVLRGVDGIVFVADSQATRLKDSVDSFYNMIENLREYDLEIGQVPVVIQYNKRDLPSALPLEDLRKHLNPEGRFEEFEAVATEGVGVRETLRAVCSQILKRLNEQANIVSDDEIIGERLGLLGETQEGSDSASGASTTTARTKAPIRKGPMLDIIQTSRWVWGGIGVGSGSITISTRPTPDGANEYTLSSRHRIFMVSRQFTRPMKYIGEDRRLVDGTQRTYHVLRDADTGAKTAPITAYVEQAKLPRVYLIYPGFMGDVHVGPEGEQPVF